MGKMLVNMGPRTFRLKPAVKIVGQDEEGKDIVQNVPRVLHPHGMPGSSIEALDAAEEKLMLGYPEIKEAGEVVPGMTDIVDKLQREKKELQESNDKLKSQLGGAATEKDTEDRNPENKPGPGKKAKRKK